METHPNPNLLTVGACSVPINLTKGGAMVLSEDLAHPRPCRQARDTYWGTPAVLLLPQTELKVCVYSSSGDLRGQPCQAPCHHHAHTIHSEGGDTGHISTRADED